MLALCGEFVLLAAVVIAAGIVLTRSADHIADATGLGKTLVGLVLLAGATSLPEMSVGFAAVRMGAVDLTAGDLFGSCLFNMLILAGLDLFTRTPGRLLSRRAAAHALSATSSIVLICIPVVGMLSLRTLSVSGVGVTSLAVILVYLAILRLIYFDELTARIETGAPPVERRPGLLPNSAAFIAAAVVILFAAPRLAHVADDLATLSGLGRTFMGTAFVSAVTSLPEMVASFTALRLGAAELAVGNIFGSNAFNMVILGLLDFAQPGPLLSQISSAHAVTALCAILVTSVATLCLLYRAERRWWVLEPDALLVALLVGGSLAIVYFQSR